VSNLNHAGRLLEGLRPFEATIPTEGHPSVRTLFGRMRLAHSERPDVQMRDRGVPVALQFALVKTRRALNLDVRPPVDPAVPYIRTGYGYLIDPIPDAPGRVFVHAKALLAAVGLYPRGHEPWNTPETCTTCGGSSRNHEGIPGECGGCDGCGIHQQGHPECGMCGGSGWLTRSAKSKVVRQRDIRNDGGILRDPPPPRCWCRPELPDPRLEEPCERRFWTPVGPVLWTLERGPGRWQWHMMGAA